MSRLNTIVGIFDLGIDIAQLNTLQALKAQAQTVSQQQALAHNYRNVAFAYKQSVIAIIDNSSLTPLIAAGMLILLNRVLQDNGLRPEMLPDLSDKEYLASAMQTCNRSLDQLLRSLNPVDRITIDELNRNVAEMSELETFFEVYPHYMNDLYLLSRVQSSGIAGKRIAIVSSVTFLVSALVGLIGAVRNSASFGLAVNIIAVLGSFVSLLALVGSFFSMLNDKSRETRQRTSLVALDDAGQITKYLSKYGDLKGCNNRMRAIDDFIKEFKRCSDVIPPPLPPPHLPLDSAYASAQAEDQFVILSQTGQPLYVSKSVLESRLASGEVQIDDLVKCPNASHWIPIRDILEKDAE